MEKSFQISHWSDCDFPENGVCNCNAFLEIKAGSGIFILVEGRPMFGRFVWKDQNKKEVEFIRESHEFLSHIPE